MVGWLVGWLVGWMAHPSPGGRDTWGVSSERGQKAAEVCSMHEPLMALGVAVILNTSPTWWLPRSSEDSCEDTRDIRAGTTANWVATSASLLCFFHDDLFSGRRQCFKRGDPSHTRLHSSVTLLSMCVSQANPQWQDFAEQTKGFSSTPCSLITTLSIKCYLRTHTTFRSIRP